MRRKQHNKKGTRPKTYLLLRSEVIDDVEEFANLLGRLALDHVRDSLAANITTHRVTLGFYAHSEVIQNLQEGLNVQIVCSEDNFKEHLLINRDEFLIPFVNVGGALAGIILVLFCISSGEWLAAMVFAVFENLDTQLDHEATDIRVMEGLRTFFKTLDDTLGRGMGWSLSPTSINKAHETRKSDTGGADSSPSSMFLIRTLRSATSLSTTNCSLSEVTRRTILKSRLEVLGEGCCWRL